MNMSLIVWDESGEVADSEHTDPDAILAALAEAGWLERREFYGGLGPNRIEYRATRGAH